MVFYTYLKILPLNGAWPALTWQNCLFGAMLLWQLQKGHQLWCFFHESVIWLSWIDQNALCFWNKERLQSTVDTMLQEHFLGRRCTTWFYSHKFQKFHLVRAIKSLRYFDRLWMLNSYLVLGLIIEFSGNCVGLHWGFSFSFVAFSYFFGTNGPWFECCLFCILE